MTRQHARAAAPWAACVLILATLTAVIFRDHLFGATTFPLDFLMDYYAMSRYAISSLQHGEWPHWIPYQSMGYPSAMNPQLVLFYPPFWALVLLHLPYTMHVATIVEVLHILFGAIGALVLLRALTGRLPAAFCGALAFLLYGGFYADAKDADIIRGFAWFPWLLWTALLAPAARQMSESRFTRPTRLTMRNWLGPLVIGFFITGAYPGQVVAGLLCWGVFIIVQALAMPTDRSDTGLVRDVVWQIGLALIGVAMAAAYLIPDAYLGLDTARAARATYLNRWYLSASDLALLVFPSRPLLGTRDFSMAAMQVPVVIGLFMSLVRARQLRTLLPFFAIAAVAAFMCLSTFQPLSSRLISAIPMLGVSRFTGADYRLFIALVPLILGTVGLANLRDGVPWRRLGIGAAITILGVEGAAWLIHTQVPAREAAGLFPFAHLTSVLCLAAVCTVWLARRIGRLELVAPVVAVLTVVAMRPVLLAATPFWADADIVRATYDDRGLPLEREGTAQTDALFTHDLTSRPARVAPTAPLALSWRGYIDGSFMRKDLGALVSGSRSAIQRHPELMEFMGRPSTIVAAPCATAAATCAANPTELAVAEFPVTGEATRYARNSVEYQVRLTGRSLVVENEIFATGWTAQCIDHGERPTVQRVDGGMRGWVLDAGTHHVVLRYDTPLLRPAAAASAVAFAGWIGLVAWVLPRRGRHDDSRNDFGRAR